MQQCTQQELVGLFESIIDNDEKIADKKSAIKMITADSAQQFKEFGKEKEVKPSDLKKAYKYYKEKKETGADGSDDDFFTLCAMVDLALGEEE